MKKVFILLAMLVLSGCEVVPLDAAGKPIIPMSAEEAASLKKYGAERYCR